MNEMPPPTPAMPHCATCTCCQQPAETASQPSRPIPSFLDDFLNDPRTVNLRNIHNTSLHVAILIKRGKVLAQATNRIGSRSRGAGFSSLTIHAERNVVKQLGDISQLRGADLYVVRISKSLTDAPPIFQSSKPCHDCEKFLVKCMREYGLNNVYYTS
jgi:hypothetical protein